MRSATTCSRSRSASWRRTAAEFAADELVPTDATDFSRYLLKIRNAKPDIVMSNLAGAQITNFMKQYMEFGLPFPVAGFGFDTAVAWGAGKGNVLGIWPLVWDSQVKTPSSQRFTDAFTKKYGKPPENQAWGDYLSTKHLAQAMNEIKTTDSTKVVEHLEKGAKFDVLKTREGYYRNWDHQLMQQMYTRALPAGRERSRTSGICSRCRRRSRRQPEPGSDRADARGQQLHDAG